MKIKDIANIRIKIIFYGIFIAFVTLLIKTVYLLHEEYDIHYNSYQEGKENKRIDIVDRNNKILATNLVTYNLYAQPSIVRDPNKIVKDLSNILSDVAENILLKKLSNSSYKGRVLLMRDLTPKQKYEINNLGHVGLFFHEAHKRLYPHKNLVSHLIGFVGRDKTGLAGFEKYLDDYGTKNNSLNDDVVFLSIDIDVQRILYEELNIAVKKFDAKGGVAVVMDINNAEIYGMVSLPDFNPYYPQEILYNRNFNNKATYDLYEMGSTFKTFTFALALENNLINMDDIYDVSKNIRIDRYRIKDFKKINEEITAREVFTRSSNVGTAQIAQLFSKELQQDFFKKLKFFDQLNIELIEKSHSKLLKRWGKANIITSSYGYGISVTSMHLMQATAAMLNGGTLLPATLIKDNNNNLQAERVISTRVSKIIRELFYETVEHGTGWRAKSKGYSIGGKTGSANKIDNKGYNEKRVLASFIAAFPINNPKFLVLSLLDEPHGIKETGGYTTGGAVSAPIVKNIIEKMAPVLNIIPDKSNLTYQ